MGRVPRATLRHMLTTCACLNARRVARTLTQRFDDELRLLEIRSTQLPFLVSLALDDGLTISELADRVVIDRTSASRKLGDMERRGWVSTKSGEDRRTRRVSLTQAGRRLLARAIPHWQRAQDDSVKRLGRREIRFLRDLVAEIPQDDGATSVSGPAAEARVP